MTDWNPTTERERAEATIEQRVAALRLARVRALRHEAALRRAVREVEEAETSLAEGHQWLARATNAEQPAVGAPRPDAPTAVRATHQPAQDRRRRVLLR